MDWLLAIQSSRWIDAHGAPIRFYKGGHVEVTGREYSSQDALELALDASLALGGKPVRCVAIVPGATVSVSTGTLEPWDDGERLQYFEDLWRLLKPELVKGLSAPTPRGRQLFTLDYGIQLELGWDDRAQLPPGAMSIRVQYDGADAEHYARHRRRQPLREQPNHRRRWLRQRLLIRQLLLDALVKTGQATHKDYARLTAYVRYRVTGALAAWQAVRNEVDALAVGMNFTELLKTRSITQIGSNVAEFVRATLPKGNRGRPVDAAVSTALTSVVWQAFDVRGGVFYEPSAALHRLLDSAFVADDVPIGALAMPADTICITPESSRWMRIGESEAIVLFRNPRSVSCLTWSRADGADVLEMLELPLDRPERTISELLDEAFVRHAMTDAFLVADGGMEERRQHWRHTLDYAIKMLLYLTVRDAQVVPNQAYTLAPRNFTGLGKRKRAQRLQEIEELYDRYVVGPALLDIEADALAPADTGPREISPHWRRPHFKMQPHGVHSTQRKLIFIGPTIVRADRLGLTAAESPSDDG
ncbi:hypothetical protein AB4156_28360 [Cupriavidus sp. 2MCAB6]|uniref:hypothetical protein n=1 Tax=Cupriavidus sp. 2MCAB6 TaxID=3232981 RepID=UPI003F8FB10B